jgi:hypothetical protein
VKGLLLAGAATIACALAVTVVFRVLTIARRAAAMTRVFVVILVLLVVVYAVTPPGLGILPADLVERRPLVELAFAAFVATALFFGGVLQLYNLADRGFSLRILIDLDEAGGRALGPGDLVAGYGAGQGMPFMLDKRIRGLVEEGLVVIEAGHVGLSPRGARAGRLFGALRALLRLDAGS